MTEPKLHFVGAPGHKVTYAALFKTRLKSMIRQLDYQQLADGIELLPGTYLFTDIDGLSGRNMHSMSKKYIELAAIRPALKLLNHPGRVKTRYSLIRAMAVRGMAGYNAYRLDEQTKPQRYPVFVRGEIGHEWPLSDLLHTEKELQDALRKAVGNGIPESQLLIIEFSGEPLPNGLFRKLSAYRIGDRIVPGESVIDSQWCVKYGTKGLTTDDLFQQELDTVSEFPYRNEVMKWFQLANIEYGRADFGMVQGQPELYEINTSPMLSLPEPQRSPIRDQTVALIWEELLEAFEALMLQGVN